MCWRIFAFDGGSGVGKLLVTIISKFLFEGEKGLVEALDHEHGKKEGREINAAVCDTVGEGPKTSAKDLHFLIVFLLDFNKLGEIGEGVGGIRLGGPLQVFFRESFFNVCLTRFLELKFIVF